MGAAALESLVARLTPVAVLAAEPPYGERPVAATAEASGLHVHHVDRLGPAPAGRWPDLFDGLDVGVCCCWGEILSSGALRAPSSGWLNLHPSALPAWRGAEPVAWQLLVSPSAIGCTLHVMTEGIDDGPILADGSVPVLPDDDLGALLPRCGTRLGELAAGVLERVADGTEVAERPQRSLEATWCPPTGTVPLVDPRVMRAAAAARVVRAFSPRPGVAVATLPSDRRLALVGHESALGRAVAADEAPGTVERSGERAHDVSIAFTDRWLHGHLLLPAPTGA